MPFSLYVSDLHDDPASIDQYLAGELDPAAHERVQAFLRASPGRRGVMTGIRAWTRGEDIGATPYPVDRSLDELWGRIDASERSGNVSVAQPVPDTRAVVPRGRTLSRRMPRWAWYTAAGSVALAAGVVAVVTGRQESGRHGGSQGTSPGQGATYMTANAQRATIVLPDGSVASLGVDSRLEVPPDYPTGNRALRLSGEALFTVAHVGQTPFTVTAGGTTARVLGTTFVVRHYPSDSITSVAVRDGKVSVQSVVLTAMQQVDVPAAGEPRVHAASPSRFTFASGTLSFDGIPLPSAIPELNRWYDADIQLGDAVLAKRHVTGEFAAGSLSDLMAILEWTYDIRVVRDGRVLTLYTKAPPVR